MSNLHFYTSNVPFFAFPAGVKVRNSASQLTDFEIPTSFWYELKSLTEALLDNVNCELLFSKLRANLGNYRRIYTFMSKCNISQRKCIRGTYL